MTNKLKVQILEDTLSDGLHSTLQHLILKQ